MKRMDNSNHILWPYEPEKEEPEEDAFDRADLMYSETKLEKLKDDKN